MSYQPASRKVHPFPLPVNDSARASIVSALDLPRQKDDPFFEAVVEVVQGVFDTPFAFISLMRGDDQQFLCIKGIDLPGTPRSHALCAYTVAAKTTIIVPDTLEDARFRDHPIVVEPPNVRFYVSTPVILSTGFCIGSLCAVDVAPRPHPSDSQIAQLERLATMLARFCEVPFEPDLNRANSMRTTADQARQSFLDLIGHELRTPLNGIVGLSDCFQPMAPDEAEIMGAIRHSADHLNAIVTSILEFTELSSGDISLDEGECEFCTLVDNAAGMLRPLLRVNEKTLTCHLPRDPIHFLGDASKLELGITCLLKNVLAHGGSSAALRLSVEDGRGLVLSVWDNGQGIPDGEQDAIWEAFRTGYETHQRPADGIGLGLPLTRRIAELHGGTVDLHSEDGGLRAELTLPSWRLGQGRT